jgi:hypothetical protein
MRNPCRGWHKVIAIQVQQARVVGITQLHSFVDYHAHAARALDYVGSLAQNAKIGMISG